MPLAYSAAPVVIPRCPSRDYKLGSQKTDVIDVRNPATGEGIGNVHVAGASVLAKAFPGPGKPKKHGKILLSRKRPAPARRSPALALPRRDEVLDTIQSETGKARRDAFAEVLTV